MNAGKKGNGTKLNEIGSITCSMLACRSEKIGASLAQPIPPSLSFLLDWKGVWCGEDHQS